MKTTLRAIGATTAAFAVVAFGTGCASSDRAPIPHGSASPVATATATPSATTDPNAVPTVAATADPHASEAPPTGPAAVKFGAANVTVAYHMAIQAHMDGYTNASLLALANPRVLDFSYLDHYFAPEVLKNLHAAEAVIVTGKETAAQVGIVRGSALWGLIQPGFTMGNPVIRNSVYSGATTNIAATTTGQPVLVLKMSFSVQYLGTQNGKKVYFQLKHALTENLIQTGDNTQPWKIYSNSFTNNLTGPFPDNG